MFRNEQGEEKQGQGQPSQGNCHLLKPQGPEPSSRTPHPVLILRAKEQPQGLRCVGQKICAADHAGQTFRGDMFYVDRNGSVDFHGLDGWVKVRVLQQAPKSAPAGALSAPK